MFYDIYLESKDSKKSAAVSSSVHIYNAQTNITHYKSMVKLVKIEDGYTSWLIHSIEIF